ncbi:MAG TPA: DoxX family protein [Alphaproteobacteria bacterium]|jgi:putative oxidoreductase|nr:DoxX family protein [Alphaproteobacteria bacterium]
MGFLKGFAPQLLSIFRIMFALLFLEHATAKLFHFPHVAMFDAVTVTSYFGIAAIIELVGGALLAIGLFTPIVAFLLSGEMAVAYFTVHAPQGFFPLLNMGEGAILYCFAFLYIAAAGPGPWSVDAMRSR